MAATYDAYFCALGERRLVSWGEWVAGDTSKPLRMPSQTPFARWYRPELGDVWSDPGDIAPCSAIDEVEAAAVERAVVQMPGADKALAHLVYVLRYPITSSRRGVPTVVRHMRLSERAVEAAVERITERIGMLRLAIPIRPKICHAVPRREGYAPNSPRL